MPAIGREGGRNAILIDELRIGQLLAGFTDVWWRRRRRRLDRCVSSLDERAQVRLDLTDDQRRGHQIACLLALEQRAILHGERHRHAGHEALDVSVLDDDLAPLGTDGQNLTLQLVLSRRRFGAATAGEDEHGRQRNPQDPHSVHCNNFHTPRPLLLRVI